MRDRDRMLGETGDWATCGTCQELIWRGPGIVGGPATEDWRTSTGAVRGADGHSHGPIPVRVSVRRVRVNRGGYDETGAYWGTGAPLEEDR